MKIVHYPHPALRHKAEPLKMISKELHLQAGHMLELMYEREGLGLAGPQVDFPFQMIVMNFQGKPENKEAECVAINPVIIETKGTMDGQEGCLSFPGLYQKVRRARQVKVQAYNLKGELFEMVCSELASRLWQHEIDHLSGVLFIDKMGPLGRQGSRKMLDEFIEDFEKAVSKGEIPPGTAPAF